MTKGVLYGSDEFNPRFILLQIFTLQCVYYASQGALTLLFSNLLGLPSHLSQLFSNEAYDHYDSYSLVAFMVVVLDCPVLIVAIIFIVERANKVLDFTLTAYFLHLMTVWLLHGFPLSMQWWVIQGSSAVATVMLAEFLCLKIEQQEITLSLTPD
mmetsp:Transcript_18979/g.34412  ORF Transcript_18979/g.34412 Transcript_18979/m.34412 type:complete len:155 (-) Transcript_18979:2642-3106(-)